MWFWFGGAARGASRGGVGRGSTRQIGGNGKGLRRFWVRAPHRDRAQDRRGLGVILVALDQHYGREIGRPAHPLDQLGVLLDRPKLQRIRAKRG